MLKSSRKWLASVSWSWSFLEGRVVHTCCWQSWRFPWVHNCCCNCYDNLHILLYTLLVLEVHKSDKGSSLPGLSRLQRNISVFYLLGYQSRHSPVSLAISFFKSASEVMFWMVVVRNQKTLTIAAASILQIAESPTLSLTDHRTVLHDDRECSRSREKPLLRVAP